MLTPADLLAAYSKMTPEEREEADALLAAGVNTEPDSPPCTLSEFVREAWHVNEPGVSLDWNWHLDAICDHTQAVLEDWAYRQKDPAYRQRIQNLAINVPPGSMKSRAVSVCAPAWMWTWRPAWRVICLSSNPKVALRDAVFCRDLVRSEWYQRRFQPQWSLKEDQDAKGNYALSSGGSRQSFGWNSRITGDRADALIADDPHDAEEVHSQAIRQGVLDRWDNAIGNRVNDLRSSVRIGIMQRVHEDDWTAHVVAQGGWEHLVIPTEYETPEQRRQACKCESCQRGVSALGWRDPRAKLGEVFFPSRYPPNVLAIERRRLGSAGYAGQHQQRPTAESGGMFKRAWWKRYELSPRDQAAQCVELMQSWDLSFKGTKDTDYVVGQVWGRNGPHRYLLHQVRGQWGFNETLKAIRDVSREWPQATLKLIEDKANGPAIIETLQTELGGIVPVLPEGSKEARASAVSPLVEAGNVWLPADADFVDGFIDEHAAFPNGAHDDQVDPMTQALRRWRYALDSLEPVIVRGSPEWMEAERRRMKDAAVAAVRAEKQRREEEWGGDGWS